MGFGARRQAKVDKKGSDRKPKKAKPKPSGGKKGSLSESGLKFATALSVLCGFNWALCIYMMIVMYYTVLTGNEVYLYFDVAGVLLVLSFFVFWFVLLARSAGDIRGTSTPILVIFFLLFIPLIAIYVFFAAVTINAIIVCILSPQTFLPQKIVAAVFGGLGMVFTLLVLTSFMIILKRFRDQVPVAPMPPVKASGGKKTILTVQHILSYVIMALMLFLGITGVWANAFYWVSFIFFIFQVVNHLAGALLATALNIWTMRSLREKGMEDMTPTFETIIHVVQYIYFATAIFVSVCYIAFGGAGLGIAQSYIRSEIAIAGLAMGVVSLLLSIAIGALHIILFYVKKTKMS